MGVLIRPLQMEDTAAVRETLIACKVFTAEEVDVASQLMMEGLASGLDGDYPLFVAEVSGLVRGYVCVGKTPLTVSTWHLYWLCVHPVTQRLGIGRALQAHAESFVLSRGGERLALETSSRPDYERTRLFYCRAGYTQIGLIADFYKRGDDCVIFCKALNRAPT
jgi:ribosomal protein S18 acetylase RimI-like enzyme